MNKPYFPDVTQQPSRRSEPRAQFHPGGGNGISVCYTNKTRFKTFNSMCACIYHTMYVERFGTKYP